jgi:cyanophycinase
MYLAKSLLILFLFCMQNAYSQQGRMLIVGGGAEKNGANSWSTPAYRWAGQGKRVAIIGTSTGSLAPYFTQQCGADYAREFAIASRDSADSQVTYDSLVSYDVIFFRGGDQWEYYDLYRDTRLQSAVEHVFSHGGTICGTSAGMHILSSIVFTAENGTVYPYECIENPNNQYVSLENDFMDLVPGCIFDTHFAERGRFARLVGFLANYKLNNGQDIIGLGMDDYTCMTIDTNRIGTVFGTGCANIYTAIGNYSLNGTKLIADSIEVVQLLQGCTYNFNTNVSTFNSLDREINTANQSETGNYTVLASGSNLLNENLDMINDLVNIPCTLCSIAIISSGSALAESYKAELETIDAIDARIFDPAALFQDDTAFTNCIQNSSKILFISNDPAILNQFILSNNGKFLLKKIHNDGAITAFVGDDARLAGKTVIGNYLTLYSSWYGELTFLPGLALLSHTVIMPNTYYNSDYYENTATAIPYTMALDTLKYGIWLTNHSYMKFTPFNGKTTLCGYGSAPVMVIENAGNLAGFSKQTSSGATTIDPRMVAGMEKAKLSFIDYTTPYVMGSVHPSDINGYIASADVQISPNPANNMLTIHQVANSKLWLIFSPEGICILQGKISGNQVTIDVSSLIPGSYLIKIVDQNGKTVIANKFVKY